MVVFISGGFGFLGGRLAEHLTYKGYSVILGSSKQRLSPRWLPDAKVVFMDWFNDESLKKCCQGVDFVVHTAGVNAKDCNLDPALALEFNGVATTRFVRIASEVGVRKFIYFSTAHVYSANLTGHIDELSPVNNLNPYATSHYAGERAVLNEASKSSIDGIVVRLSNAFGAPVDKNTDCWGLLINDICRQIVENGEILLRSSGNQQRDFIPIARVCDATENLLGSKLNSEEGLFNLGTFKSYAVLEMVKIVQERSEAVLNIRPEIKILDQELRMQHSQNLSYRSIRWGGNKGTQYALVREIDETLIFCRNHFSKK